MWDSTPKFGCNRTSEPLRGFIVPPFIRLFRAASDSVPSSSLRGGALRARRLLSHLSGSSNENPDSRHERQRRWQEKPALQCGGFPRPAGLFESSRDPLRGIASLPCPDGQSCDDRRSIRRSEKDQSDAHNDVMCKSTGARCPFSPPPIQHNGMAHYAHQDCNSKVVMSALG